MPPARAEDMGISYFALELDQREDGEGLAKALSGVTTQGMPRVFIHGELAGGSSEIGAAYKSGELAHWVSAKEAAEEKDGPARVDVS